MHTMKTAISVEDHLLREADRTAKQMGVSRSRLFSMAVEEYLKSRRQAEMLEQLNRAYADEPTPIERRTLAGMKAKFHMTIKDRW
jgi:metal-responsive CopG/Arc/MetJ family transcriptional regulator